MKTLFTVTILLIFAGCTSQTQPSPSNNRMLNRLTNTNATSKKQGWMQQHLDEWLENEWRETTQNFRQEKNKKQHNTSTTKRKERFLQYYVDKAAYYIEHRDGSNERSHFEEMKALPVIGESKKRR